MEYAFKHLNFEVVGDELLDDIIFLIAQQWDMGIILNWFNKGKEEIGQLGMSEYQLRVLSARGINSEWTDARSQFAASLYKIGDQRIAVDLLLKYHEDDDEYVRRLALKSLHKLNYHGLNDLLIISWNFDEEYERRMCLEIWKQTADPLFDKFCALALTDERDALREFAGKLKNGE